MSLINPDPKQKQSANPNSKTFLPPFSRNSPLMDFKYGRRGGEDAVERWLEVYRTAPSKRRRMKALNMILDMALGYGAIVYDHNLYLKELYGAKAGIGLLDSKEETAIDRANAVFAGLLADGEKSAIKLVRSLLAGKRFLPMQTKIAAHYLNTLDAAIRDNGNWATRELLYNLMITLPLRCSLPPAPLVDQICRLHLFGKVPNAYLQGIFCSHIEAGYHLSLLELVIKADDTLASRVDDSAQARKNLPPELAELYAFALRRCTTLFSHPSMVVPTKAVSAAYEDVIDKEKRLTISYAGDRLLQYFFTLLAIQPENERELAFARHSPALLSFVADKNCEPMHDMGYSDVWDGSMPQRLVPIILPFIERIQMDPALDSVFGGPLASAERQIRIYKEVPDPARKRRAFEALVKMNERLSLCELLDPEDGRVADAIRGLLIKRIEYLKQMEPVREQFDMPIQYFKDIHALPELVRKLADWLGGLTPAQADFLRFSDSEAAVSYRSLLKLVADLTLPTHSYTSELKQILSFLPLEQQS